ncbi:methyltransferase [Leptolyngbya sp. KIOST-1]|uniref:methyltransferase n=1 Tax=Leptolyngbya sp. KIOST-1 TaxID=1229172 RepID=UPI0009E09CCC|nr:methyltransferase [Leptolyngbya sp. KIOST-1]
MVSQTQSAATASPQPADIVMQMVMGAWVSQAISTLTRLDVPDRLKDHGPQSVQALTQNLGVDAKPEFLERVLRACASIGLFSESADGRFGITPLSEVLTSDSPMSLKKLTEVFGASWWQLWGGLENALRTGQSQPIARFGMNYWEYCLSNPREMADFAAAMKANSLNSMRGVLGHCDFSQAKTVVDVGGGAGHLAIALLKQYPHLQAVVLDLPELISIAQQNMQGQDETITQRVKFVGGDMFRAVPEADVYILKHIMHDWDDAQCLQILKNCRQSMTGDGRLLCVDAVLPPLGDTQGTPAKFLDVNMIVFGGGNERTEEQWRELYAAAGFELIAITPLQDNFGTSIVEGKKAKSSSPRVCVE